MTATAKRNGAPDRAPPLTQGNNSQANINATGCGNSIAPDLSEARRLFDAGFKMVQLLPNSKRPAGGEGWNLKPVARFNDKATGYGILLKANEICSVDPDNAPLAAKIMAAWGFDLDQIMDAGVRSASTRPGSGGRSAFRMADGMKWIKCSFEGIDGCVLELRAASDNLQDVIPGLVYADKSGELRTQSYLNCKRLDEAPDLPADFLAFWQRMGTDIEFLRQQQGVAGEAIGYRPYRSVSAGGKLAFPSPHRVEFNRAHKVADLLPPDLYEQKGRRWKYLHGEGQPGVRPIADNEDLWQSDHASDRLSGTFDAWTVFVLYHHAENVEAAEAAWEVERDALMVREFEVIPIDPTEPPPLPNFIRNKAGRAISNAYNLEMAVRSDLIGWQIGWDTFRNEIMLAPPGVDDQWRECTDDDYTKIRTVLERSIFAPIGKELTRDIVSLVSKRNTFDSAQKWLSALKWDGVPRVEKFFSTYLGAEDNPYHRAVGLYLWSALAGRICEPAIKCDMAPILVGAQGLRKSSSVAAIVPHPDLFVEADLTMVAEKLGRLLRGKIVIELAELKGMRRADLEHVKSTITRTHDEWDTKFKEKQTRYARRCVFIGTTNDDEFLQDETGHRRWLPVRVGVCDPAAIAADRSQLWAEAVGLFVVHGVVWESAEVLARHEHEQYVMRDAWEDVVATWISNNENDQHTSEDILFYAMNMNHKDMNQVHKRRLAGIMKRLGFVQRSPKVGGKTRRVWEKSQVGK